MHVKVKHPEHYQEFKEKFDEFKKGAVVLDTATRQPPQGGGAEPGKVDDKSEYKTEKKEDPVKKPGGDDQPSKGKSFLSEFDKWLDVPEF